jgi:hypothetical protein
VSVAVTSGLYRRGAGRLFCALLAGHEKCKLLLSRMTGSVTRGLEGSQLMRSHPLMMTGFRCFRVSGVAGIMIVSMWRMLSDMRRGK